MPSSPTIPMTAAPITVAVAGRPNVGKSTLFNRLAGKKLAIVHDEPGVTRDWQTAPADLYGLEFLAMDIPGLEGPDGELETAVQDAATQALQQADVVLLMLDGQVGITPADEAVVERLRISGKPVIVTPNKCEKETTAITASGEAAVLGFEDICPISALHGTGLDELAGALNQYCTDETGQPLPITTTAPDMQLVILGRPNAGKSTLFNTLVGAERAVVSDVAGTTRDTLSIPLPYIHDGEEKTIRLIDTAGLRKRAKVQEIVERASTSDARRALIFAHIAVLVVDATQNLEKQDFTIARQIVSEGRPLVLVLNKADLIPRDKHAALKEEAAYRLSRSLPQLTDVPVVLLSAAASTGKAASKNKERLLAAAWDLYEKWNQRQPTARLNEWLGYRTSRHKAPSVRGRQLKLRFMTQIKTRPPTFAIFCNLPKDVPDAYVRYLEKSLREDFGLDGVPLRLMLKGGENPYAGKS